VKRLVRKIVLSAAVLTPGLAYFFLRDRDLSSDVFLIVLIGLIGACAAVFAIRPKIKISQRGLDTAPPEYASLLTRAALASLREQDLDPQSLRIHMTQLITRAHGAEGFATFDDQVAMVLAQIMARWGITDPMQLGDSQARELWLAEQLMRATPAEAGALAKNFKTPDVMLTMRDRVADNVIA
jgi:hypothetical protein